jgi:hypothetical protein
MFTLVVLNDGETYSDIRGCSIIVVDQDGMNLLEAGYKVSDVIPISEITLGVATQPKDDLYDSE